MDQGLSLITLGVADVARSRRFYEALGWRASGASQEEVAFFQLGGIGLALFGRAALAEDAGLPEARGVRRRGARAQRAHGEEVDAILDQARAAGARILTPARAASWGGYFGYFADPDDHPWEVAWNPQFPLRPDGSLQLPD